MNPTPELDAAAREALEALRRYHKLASQGEGETPRTIRWLRADGELVCYSVDENENRKTPVVIHKDSSLQVVGERTTMTNLAVSGDAKIGELDFSNPMMQVLIQGMRAGMMALGHSCRGKTTKDIYEEIRRIAERCHTGITAVEAEELMIAMGEIATQGLDP